MGDERMDRGRWGMIRLLILLIGAAAPLASTGVAHEGHDHAPQAFGGIYPRLSADGQQVAFSYQGAIWRIPRTGGVMIRLTSQEGFDIDPAWSPDGKLIAFARTRNFAGGTLQVIHAEDGSPVALPREVNVRDKLHFDPAGQRVLASFQGDGGAYFLGWFDLRSGELKRVGELPARARTALSVDGRWIALATNMDLPEQQTGNNGADNDVWKMPAEGGPREAIGRFPSRIYDLCWSADGQSLYVVSDRGVAHNDIWQLPLNSFERGARKLTSGQADEDCPSVSIDGRWLLMTDNRWGPTAFVITDQSARRSSLIEVAGLDFRQPTGRLILECIDQRTKESAAARISIQQIDGKYQAPPGSLYRLLDREMHFYAHDLTRLTIPVGRYRVQASRGPEYRPSRQVVEIHPNQSTTVTAQLERWTDQRAASWYSGESHIHANYGYGHWYNSPRTMLDQCSGEDLIVCNFMVANSDSDGVFDREYFRGRLDPLSQPGTLLYWNEEFRSTIWGHMTLLNLKQLVEPIFTGFEHTTHPHDHPTNADIADLVHDQGGHVNYTHPAQNVKDPYLTAYSAKELPIDVALGKVDTIDVMGSNHLANMPVWYGLLNCGFRIPASAGTDCFLNRIPSRLPGSDRAYVQVQGEFSYARWIDNLKAGRSFVTNGPMLRFSAQGTGLGELIRLEAPARLKLQAEVTSLLPVDRVEFVVNGRVAASAKGTGDGREIRIEEEVAVEQSGWIAVRAAGPPDPDQPRGAFAHSSPIYVEVVGKPLDSRADAEYFLSWIDRLRSDIRKRNRIPARHQVPVESQLASARAVFLKLAQRE